MSDLLKIDQLSVFIHQLPVLKNISLSVAAGEILGVIGESGSGKSMTANAIMQLLPSGAGSEGAISLDGHQVLEKSDDEMCALRGETVGMVFQEPMTALNPVKTIGAQVAETILIHDRSVGRSDAMDRAATVLERVGLPPQKFPLDRFPHELSGGQRQRVVIAMAIALKPKLLIADEPTTALDVTTQAQILQLLKKLVQEDGMGLMLITHDLAVVSEMADKLVIMKNGEIVERGETKALFANMQHPYTKALFAASTHVPEREAHESDEDGALLSVSQVVRDYLVSHKGLFGAPEFFRAVNKVSFNIFKGENLGLVGESGCGKSTLTRAILGLEAIQDGDILMNGKTIFPQGRFNPDIRRNMQVVFQDPYGSFNPRHKVERLVAEPFHLLTDAPKGAQRRKAVEKALEDVGLPADAADKYIHEFSGGQRQRIAIARALIIRPQLIILDEAVSALDVSIRAEILDLLADLSKTHGLTYLFISHDLSVVRSVTDRVLVMKSGEIVEQGETEVVFNAPQHAYTRTLLAAAPQLPDVRN